MAGAPIFVAENHDEIEVLKVILLEQALHSLSCVLLSMSCALFVYVIDFYLIASWVV